MADPSSPQLLSIAIPALSGLIGTTLGFIANMLSAKLADERKLKQDLMRTDEQYAHQARISRAVLKSELASMVRAFKSEQDFAGNISNPVTIVPIVGYLRTFEKDLSVVGLLHADEAEAVMNAFYVYQERTWYIRKNAAETTREPLSPPNEPVNYVLQDANYRRYLVQDAGHIVKAAEEACEALGKLRTPPSPPITDLLRKVVQGSEGREMTRQAASRTGR